MFCEESVCCPLIAVQYRAKNRTVLAKLRHGRALGVGELPGVVVDAEERHEVFVLLVDTEPVEHGQT